MTFCSNLWSKACSLFCLGENGQQQVNELMSDEAVLQEAYEELQQAQNWFANLNEPEMIDYAIFKIKAAEKHYDYLLKRIKTKSRNQNNLV